MFIHNNRSLVKHFKQLFRQNNSKCIHSIFSINTFVTNYGSRYLFSQQGKKTHNQNQHESKLNGKQQQQSMTIQVSLEEFNRMKSLLSEMKTQINQLREQQERSKLSGSPKPTLQQKHYELSGKISKFKESVEEQLFFASPQQQLSFTLLKINGKQQFGDVIEKYLRAFLEQEKKYEDKLTSQAKLAQQVKLLYLIFHRYVNMQGAMIDDLPFKNLVIKLSSYPNLLQQSELQFLLSTLNSQKKQKLSQLSTLTTNPKHIQSLHTQFTSYISHLKSNLLNQHKLLKSISHLNSEVLSHIYHFFTIEQLQPIINQLTLLRQFSDLQSDRQAKFMVYNPVNLSHLLIMSFKSTKIVKTYQLEMFNLFYRAIYISEKQYEGLKSNDENMNIKLERSIENYNYRQFNRLKYESLVHFLQNGPSNHFMLKICQSLLQSTSITPTFHPIQQLRLCLSLLTWPQQFQWQSSYWINLSSLLTQTLSSHSTLFQPNYPTTQLSLSPPQNFEFTYLKQLTMLLSQLTIQLFKLYRLTRPQKKQTVEQLGRLVGEIVGVINVVCLEKLEVRDMFKASESEYEDRLILGLSVFQFVVNMNIIGKWQGQLLDRSSLDENTVLLMKTLVQVYLINFSQITNLPLTKQQKLKLSQQMIITILISMQHASIRTTLNYFLQNPHQRDMIVQILQSSVGQDQTHKYYEQYRKIYQQILQVQ